MILARTLIFGFPLLVAALAWWSAGESRRSHARGKDGIVVMLSQDKPALNPYLPETEAERELLELVHEPLIRIGPDGALVPTLAELWRWTQDVTCWFADEAEAKRALEQLQAQIGETNRWAEWHLTSADVVAASLRLSFSDLSPAGVQGALEVIAERDLQPAVLCRVDSRTPLRSAWDKFVASTTMADQIHRVWFDGTSVCELVVSGKVAPRLMEDLRRHLDKDADGSATVKPLAEVGVLVEPVLDLDIRPGQLWSDGTPVTAGDAKATLEFLRGQDWPIPAHEALRQIQSLESLNNGSRLRVVFRRSYGPALCALADLPVLPGAWLRDHSDGIVAGFSENPPPGAGTHRISAQTGRSLVLTPVHEGGASPRFLFSFSVSPLMTEIGTSTQTVDLVWPASAARHSALRQLRFTPPRQRLVVLWNTRHEILQNVRLREALACATDTEDLIRSLPGRLGRVDASLFAPGLWYSTRAARSPFELASGRGILEEEGWSLDGAGVARRQDRPFELTLLVPGGDELHTKAAQRLVAQWAALGARVKIEIVADASAFAQRLREHRFDAALVDQRFEVSWDQLPWWHSSQAKPGGTNFCGVIDPQVDLLLEALSREFEPAHVPSRVRELEAKLLQLHPMLTLFTTHDEAAAMQTLADGATAAAASATWTLRQLAVPPKRAPAAPVIHLQMRVTE